MSHTDSEAIPLPFSFPNRMFAFGEEPLGIRVTPYHKPNCISKILNALQSDEIEVIRDSPFGKLIEIAERPSFSGRFGHLLLSRQLKTRKKHEVWFLFAGRPVRFSIKEFALVTGLNCRNFPRHSKKKSNRNLSEKPYWGELFGSMKEVPVSNVITMLKRKTVTDPEIRIKYALLALVSSVILPTSHSPRISHDYAEKIKVLQQFLDYPWGRVSFDMLISSIKERNEVSLSQNTIAVKGFVMAIQLVMIDAVPSLIGGVQEGGSSCSEDGSADEEENIDEDTDLKKSINPVHVRDIDTACKAHVNSIISAGVELTNVSPDPGWSDDEEDVLVDNLVRCIEDSFPFSNSHFTGGVSKADVARMREEQKKDTNPRKTAKSNLNPPNDAALDAQHVAQIVKESISADLLKIGQEIKNLGVGFSHSQEMLMTNFDAKLMHWQNEIMKLINNPTPCNRPHASEPPHKQSDTNLRPRFPVTSAPVDPSNIIQNAMEFANNDADGNPSVEERAAHVNTEIADQSQIGVAKINPGVAHTVDSNAPSAHCVNKSASPFVGDVHNPNLENVDNGLTFPDPSFSLGLTQENRKLSIPDVQPMDKDPPVSPIVNDEEVLPNRRSKRARVVPRGLVSEFVCEKRFLTRAWEAYLNAICTHSGIDYAEKFSVLEEKLESPFAIDAFSLTLQSKELAAIVDRSSHVPAKVDKVLDVLIHHTRSVFLSHPDHIQFKNSGFLDTKFVSSLAKSFAKFSKAPKKETFQFPSTLVDHVVLDCPIDDVSRYYFPFNFDKQHWVGVCVDCSASQVTLLDCNTSLRSDGIVSKELRYIAQMFPYLLRQAGKQTNTKDLKPLTIERPRILSQNYTTFDSGITAILLIQAHAVGGVDVCKCITPDVLDFEAKRIAVMIYEKHIGDL